MTSLSGKPSAIKPLDKVELAGLGSFPLPAQAFCPVHWFDYHPSGIGAVGFYGGGLQLVDLRDPSNLKPYGHAVWGASEVWDAYCVPVYNINGTATGKKTNIVYTVDLVRGLDVYTVDLPAGSSDGSSALLPVAVLLGALVLARRCGAGSPYSPAHAEPTLSPR